MAFCNYSTEKVLSDSIKLDNAFILDYMPSAPENFVKIYLFGLYLCASGDSSENNLDNFATLLGFTKEEILGAFVYWEEKNLVKLINIEPIEVKYLPIRRVNNQKNVFNGKYSEFCSSIQEIITGRMITTNEYYEYMSFLDLHKMEPTALLMIARYCTDMKGDDVGYNYILTVAKAYAHKGIFSYDAVVETIKEENNINDDIYKLLKIFGIKRAPLHEEKEVWTFLNKELEYDSDTILAVAKSLKVKNKSGLNLLKNKMQKYYAMALRDYNDISEYEVKKDNYYSTAKTVTKNLGVYYENLEPVVEQYITKWITWGFDGEVLADIATNCFKNSIRTLEGMDDRVTKLYKLGVISKSAIDEYVSEAISTDNEIKKILEKLGLSRAINSYDRDMYRTWTYTFKFTEDVIEYAASLSAGKVQAMQYLNKVLITYKDNNIDSLEKAKNFKYNFDGGKKTDIGVSTHSYSADDLNSLFASLDDVKF